MVYVIINLANYRFNCIGASRRGEEEEDRVNIDRWKYGEELFLEVWDARLIYDSCYGFVQVRIV